MNYVLEAGRYDRTELRPLKLYRRRESHQIRMVRLCLLSSCMLQFECSLFTISAYAGFLARMNLFLAMVNLVYWGLLTMVNFLSIFITCLNAIEHCSAHSDICMARRLLLCFSLIFVIRSPENLLSVTGLLERHVGVRPTNV